MQNNVLLPTAKVKLYARDGSEIHFKALIDRGSQLSFISKKAVVLLKFKPTQINVNVISITNSSTNFRRCNPLQVHSLATPYKVSTNFHVVEQITCKLPQWSFDITSLNIPPNIKLADETFNHSSDLLLGADIFFQILLPSELNSYTQFECTQPASGAKQRPRLINTQLGYIISRNLPHFKSSNGCNQVALKYITCDSDLNDTLVKFWPTESVPETHNEKTSEQELCEHVFSNSVQLKENRFEVALPLKLPIHQINYALGD